MSMKSMMMMRQVAQPQLAGNRWVASSWSEDGVVEVARARRSHRCSRPPWSTPGLVDDEVAARLQIHAPRQRLGNLFVDVVQVEDRGSPL